MFPEFFGIWELEIGISGNSLKLADFWPISTCWVFFQLSFGHWAWFWAQNFKFPIFLDFSGISGNCLKIYKLWPLLQSGTCFPLNFGHWFWFCFQKFYILEFIVFLWLLGNFQIPDSRKCCNMNIYCLFVKKQIMGSILDYFFTF